MLHICVDFPKLHGLRFNANKTQLIRFGKGSRAETFMFCGTRLQFSQEVIHLGHTLLENLNDSLDISRKIKDLLCRANYILCTFSFADPFVQSMLIKSFCLSLYGGQLW